MKKYTVPVRLMASIAFLVSFMLILIGLAACGSQPITGEKVINVNGTDYAVSGTISPADKTIATLTISPDPLNPKPEPTKEVPPVTTAVTPDIVISAGELYQAYNADPVAADALYKGKLIQVTGTVTGAEGQNIPRRYFILFEGVKVELKDGDDHDYYETPEGKSIPPLRVYAWVSAHHIGWQFVYTGHCVGFIDNQVLLTP